MSNIAICRYASIMADWLKPKHPNLAMGATACGLAILATCSGTEVLLALGVSAAAGCLWLGNRVRQARKDTGLTFGEVAKLDAYIRQNTAE